MRRSTIAAIAAAAALGFSFGSPGPAHARLIDQAALRNEVGLSQPQISPDGKSIAFMKSTMDFVKDERHSQLMLLDIASGAIRPLTYDRTGVDSPRWSPTGDRLAFIADAGPPDNTQSQIFVMPLSGGDALYIGVRNSARPLGLAFNVGMRLPAYLSGSGKAMLSLLSPDEVRRLYAGGLATRLTKKGPKDVDATL